MTGGEAGMTEGDFMAGEALFLPLPSAGEGRGEGD